jgi:hypothetical protein
MGRQRPEPRGMVLDRMCADDSKSIRRPHAQFQQCFISMMTSRALLRRCKTAPPFEHTPVKLKFVLASSRLHND